MTIILEKPDRPVQRSYAGGEGGLGQIWTASRDAMLLVENSLASEEALSRAYTDIGRELHTETGQQLQNPVRQALEDFRQAREAYSANVFSGQAQSDPEPFDQVLARRVAEFDAARAEAVSRVEDPELAARLLRPADEDATRMAREADERLGRLLASRDGIGKWGALIGGGMLGSLADPVMLLSLGLGAGPGAARTVAGRVLTVAGREALVNAGTELAVQPLVQAWREKAGLPHGLGVAAQNVAFAGLFGSLFGAGGQGAAEVYARTFGRTRTADVLDEAAAAGDLDEPARAIIDGDGFAARESLGEIRPALAAEARGALDAGARIDHADLQRPATVNAERHDSLVATADRVINDPSISGGEAWPGFSPDPVQIHRVAQSVVPDVVSDALDAERPLTRFLADRGGVSDFLESPGKQDTAEIVDQLFRASDETIDQARLAAAEAGHFNHLYGSPAEAAQKSTPEDLIGVLEAELRTAENFTAARAGVEDLSEDIARHAGPGVDDAVLDAAARIAAKEGISGADALARVLSSPDLDAPRRQGAAPIGRDEPLPGWTDEDLFSASENRPGQPEANGLDDPGKPAQDDLFAAELADADPSLEIPTETGIVKIEEIRRAIRETQDMAALVEACRI